MKLIRDNTPNLERGSIKIARDDIEYEMLLRMKLMEESAEVSSSTSDEEMISEIGDLMEVLYALIDLKGIQWNHIHLAANEKAARKGIFKERVMLMHYSLENKHK